MDRRVERKWAMAAFLGLAALAFLYAVPLLDDRGLAIPYAAITVPAILGAGIAAWARSRRNDADRLAWRLLALSCLMWGLGEAGWNWTALVQGAEVPYPHWSDAFYLLNVPLTVAGVLMLTYRRGSGQRIAVHLLDGIIAAAALFLLFWSLFLRAATEGYDGSGLGLAVTYLYPLGDVAALTALGLAVSRLERERLRDLWPLLVGLALVAFADAGYTWLVLTDGAYFASWFDLGWTAGAFGIGWAALRPGTAGSVRPGAATRTEQWLPIAASAPAILVLAIDLARTQRVDLVTVCAGATWAVVLLLRQQLFTRSQVRLSRQLDEAQSIAGLGTWRWDAESDALVVSPRAARMLQAPVAADGEHRLAFQALLERTEPEGRAAFQAGWDDLVVRGVPLERTLRLAPVTAAPAGPDGGQHVLVKGQRIRTGVQGTVQDVTAGARLQEARARAERQQDEVKRLAEVARAKANFINTAAHELNTPLTPIKLSLANLRTGNTRGDPLALLERNVERLSRLLHDVLEGARLQSDKLRLQRHNMDLAALVREAVEEHQPQAQAHGIRLEAAADQPVAITGDPGRLHEVVMNLLSNALKFTPKGGHVSARVEAQPDGNARITVQDSGRGMAPQDIPLLFQPFTQVGPPHEGTGLGLYIARGIVESHGGHIAAFSAGDGQGSRFEVVLPLAPAGAISAA